MAFLNFQHLSDLLKQQEFPTSCLYVVATPIGNLGDITIRAAHVLNLVDGIACEDTRHSQVLLNQLGIHKPLMAVHEHNEHQGAKKIIDCLQRGERWAYISDAGTPAISDPGGILVNACISNGLRTIPIPGPSAITALASVSGGSLEASNGHFQFLGFCPVKANERTDFLNLINQSTLSSIFYETPQRIEKTLNALHAAISDQTRIVVIGRELTKRFETIAHLPISELSDWLSKKLEVRGEFAILVSGMGSNSLPKSEINSEANSLAQNLSNYLGSKQIAEVISKQYGLTKKQAYQIALEAKAED